MGSVHVEQVNEGRGCGEWYYFSLSDPNLVKLLIKNRCVYDKNFQAKIDNYDGTLEFVEPIIVMYVDLDNLIKECNFKEKYRKILFLFMYGFDTNDIVKKLNIPKRTVNHALENMSNKISKLNNTKYNQCLKNNLNRKIVCESKILY